MRRLAVRAPHAPWQINFRRRQAFSAQALHHTRFSKCRIWPRPNSPDKCRTLEISSSFHAFRNVHRKGIVSKSNELAVRVMSRIQFLIFFLQKSTPLRELGKRSCTNTDRDARNLHHLPVIEGVGPLIQAKPSTTSTVAHHHPLIACAYGDLQRSKLP